MGPTSYDDIRETFRCLISCRKNMPGMRLEDSGFTVSDLEKESALFEQLVKSERQHKVAMTYLAGRLAIFCPTEKQTDGETSSVWIKEALEAAEKILAEQDAESARQRA